MNVIFVDDEEDVVLSTVKLAARQRPDYRFEGFTDPGLALARLTNDEPKVLVTDLRMPGMTGLELLLAARAAVPDLPAVVITAYGSQSMRADILKRSSVTYLEKPFELAHLLDAIERVSVPRLRGFSGVVTQMSLPDIVQLHALARFTGALRIEQGAQQGCLWFVAGEIRHAVCGTTLGSEAVCAMVAWEDGMFTPHRGQMPPAHTIALPWQELLIEGCRRIDEGRLWVGAVAPDAELQGLMARAQASLQTVSEIDGLLGACIVDSLRGVMLAAIGGGAAINLELAAAGNIEVVLAKRRTVLALGLEDQVEDMLISLGRQYHMIRPLSAQEGLFAYLVLDRAKATPALGRHMLGDVAHALAR